MVILCINCLQVVVKSIFNVLVDHQNVFFLRLLFTQNYSVAYLGMFYVTNLQAQ
ncbi:hypothetical protein NY78_4353 [Desulfovibrio sp. TomC]|nr:hypothetical protein NY78_4353 [Desulfovibrio sp. TomC]